MNAQAQFLAQLDEVLAEWAALRKQSRVNDASDLPDQEVLRVTTRARAAIRRIGGLGSAYFDQGEAIIKFGGYPSYVAVRMIGVVDSLRADVASGFVQGVSELIHGTLFADFLEMAQHLLEEGYKDAAAVIAGSALESHLRQLCEKMSVPTDAMVNGELRPKKADQVNADLAKASTYSKLDQKNVTAWLGLRNKAAHGQYAQYEASQVGVLISGVRDFVTRTPA
jgi:hypothetical protein